MSSNDSEIDAPDNGDSPDLRGPAAIVEGSVIGGFSFIGPFETIEHAYEWWRKTWKFEMGIGCTVVLLEDPKAHASL